MITEKVKRGCVGPHQVYSVGKTGYVYIPRKLQKVHKQPNSQEARYKTLFFNMVVTDFYFSYTYDLTHTLQHNLTYTGKPFYNKVRNFFFSCFFFFILCFLCPFFA